MNETKDDAGSNDLVDLFQHHRPRLLTFLQRSGVGEEANDLLQEAWLRLSRIDGFVPDEPLSYFFRMLHNLILDRKRSLFRDGRRDRQWTETIGPAFPGIADEPGSERRLIAAEELRAVHQALDALGEPTAGIFRRHRIDQVTQRVIAQEYGMGLSTVEKHLRKAYAALLQLRRSRDEV
jgi:RNA polymerase sigma-70 factor (ECF subfamily)